MNCKTQNDGREEAVYTFDSFPSPVSKYRVSRALTRLRQASTAAGRQCCRCIALQAGEAAAAAARPGWRSKQPSPWGSAPAGRWLAA